MAEIKIDRLVRSRRRTVGLEITQDAKLVIRAPIHAPLEYIQNILLKKQNWILEKQAFIQERKDRYLPKKFINGESFYYLGRSYRLNLVEADAIKLTDHLEFPKTMGPDARDHLIQWYRSAAYEKIKERVDQYSRMTGLSYSGIKISGAKKRLGSCSAKGNLNFTWRLVMAPLEIVDYVVAHELVHLEEKNHSQKFWNRLKAILPDYKKRREFLKFNNHIFTI